MASQKGGRSGRLTAKPLAIRTAGVEIDERTRARVREKLGRALGKFARRIERVSVRFRDVNGPRGGIDQLCRIKVVLTGPPSLVAEGRASSARGAFDLAAGVAERAVRRAVGRLPLRGGRAKKRRPSRAGEAAGEAAGAGVPEGSLIGRRVGRSAERLKQVAARPEKVRRDAFVDTAQPGTSASDRKAGAGSTARRNTKLNVAGMTSTLEDSAQDRPSRKSTRRSSDRAKRDTGLRVRQTERTTSPGARARRSRTRGPARR